MSVPGFIENTGIFILARYPRMEPSCTLAEEKKKMNTVNPFLIVYQLEISILGASESLGNENKCLGF